MAGGSSPQPLPRCRWPAYVFVQVLLSRQVTLALRGREKIGLRETAVRGETFNRCRIFKSLSSSKHYRFDVSLSIDGTAGNIFKKYCWDGQCIALDLLRSQEQPILRVHEGRFWKVVKTKPTQKRKRKEATTTTTSTEFARLDSLQAEDLRFSLSDDFGAEPIELDLKAMKYIVYLPAGEGTPENFLIIDEEDTCRLDLVNGVFNSPEVIEAGLDAYARKKAKEQVLKAAKIFSPLEVLRAGGATTPEQRFSIGDRPRSTLSLQHLMTSVAWKGSRQRKWLEEVAKLSAPLKLFEKIRCMPAFEMCRRIRTGFLLVPKGKPCPADDYSVPEHHVDGNDAPPGRRPVVAVQQSVEKSDIANVDTATRTSNRRSRSSNAQEAPSNNTAQLDNTAMSEKTDDGSKDDVGAVDDRQTSSKGSGRKAYGKKESKSQSKTPVTPHFETLLDDELPSESRPRNRDKSNSQTSSRQKFNSRTSRKRSRQTSNREIRFEKGRR